MEPASPIGRVVAERYRIEAKLGSGGMSEVYRARRMADGRPVAVKLLQPGATDVLGKRFVREARIAARLRHPHVVRLLDSGRAPGGLLYLAMELLDGVPISHVMDHGLGARGLCALMAEALDALAHVHARGIVHRDIKPENILVVRRTTGELTAKVSDFGIAAALGEEMDERLTREGYLVGTPDFIAPELVEGGELIGPAVDIYALGVTFYELLCDRLPFGGSLTERLYARVHEAPPPLRPRKGLEMPEELHAIVAKMMAQLPENRYRTAADARAALVPIATEPRLGQDEWDDLRDSAQAEEAFAAEKDEAALDPVETASQSEILWGREAELTVLDAIAREVEAGAGRVVLLTGDPGVGKTALMSSIALELAETGRAHLLQGSYREAAGVEAGLRGALERMLGVSGRDHAAVEAAVRELLRRQGVEGEEAVDLVEFLRPGDRSAPIPQQETFALIVRTMRGLARDRPVVLTLDDLHEGGTDAAAFLDYLLFECTYEPFPVLVLATVRSHATDERFLRALQRSDRHEGLARRTIRVRPLQLHALQQLLVARLGLGSEDAQRIASRADGNPMFAVVLARSSRRPSTGDGPAVGADLDGSPEALPDVLHRLIAETLDQRLASTSHPGELREMLTRIAVVGDQVSLELLEEMCSGDDAISLDVDLERLIDDAIDIEVLEETGAAAVAFVHGLVREALLAGVGRRRLRAQHQRAAAARERYAGDRPGPEAGAIGDHVAAAGDDKGAVGWWLLALAYEGAAGDAGRGTRWGRRALAAMAAEDTRRTDGAMALAQLLRDTGELEEAVEILEPLVAGPLADRALVAGELLAEILQELGRGSEWGKLVEALGRRVDAAGAVGHRAYLRARAFWLNNQGRPADARQAAERALADAQPGSESVKAAVRLAWACKLMGDLEDARAAAARAVADATGRNELLAEALRIKAFVDPPRTGPGGIVELALEALSLQRRGGRAGRVVRAISDTATTLLIVGDHESALSRFDEAKTLADELGLSHEAMRTELFAILCRLELGRVGNAVRELHRLEAAFVGGGAAGYMPLLHLAEACAFGLDGRVDAALARIVNVADLDGPPFSAELGRVMALLGGILAREPSAFPEAARTQARRLLESAARYLAVRDLEDEARRCRELLAELAITAPA